MLADELTRKLRDLSQRYNVAVNNIIQGAWALLLSRYSGRPDIVFGVTRSGRSSAGNSRKVGFYINTLPLRILIEPQSKVSNWRHR